MVGRRGGGLGRHVRGIHHAGQIRCESFRRAHGLLLLIGPDLPDDLAQIGQATRVRVRLVPAVDQTEAIIRGVSLVATDKAIKLALELRPKLILMPLDSAGIDASALQSGHLPETGTNQIIAGASADHHDRLTAGDRDLEVAGVLKPAFALMRNAYVIPPSETADTLFGELDPSVHAGTVLRLTDAQVHDRKLLQKLEKDLPTATYTVVMPMDRLEPGTSYLNTSPAWRPSSWVARVSHHRALSCVGGHCTTVARRQ